MMEYVPSPEFPQLPSVQESNEWTYIMRRTAQEIVPGLYLGPYSAASKSKLDVLLQLGITHVVCVRQDIEAHMIRPNFEDRFKYLVLNIADNNTENIIRHFSSVCHFIDEAINSNGKCLVHGNAGISRSAALVMAYIMQKYGLNSREAFNIVQNRRFCIKPNDGFMAQLAEFEPIYRAQQLRFNGQCSTENSRHKRRIDDVEDAASDLTFIHAPLNGKTHHEDDFESVTTKRSPCCFHDNPNNTIQFTNCNYIVEKVIEHSQPPTTIEAMDQEISS